MNYLDQILEAWLPTKWSKLIAGLSITSGTGAFFLPEFLKLLCIKIPDHTILLIRIGLPLLIWLFGTLLVLLMVVQHSKTLKAQKQFLPPLPKPNDKLPQFQEDILHHLHNHKGGLFTFQIAKLLDIPEDKAWFHLEELLKNKFVRRLTLPVKGLPGQHSWIIEPKGEKYLRENKLIS